VIWPPIQSIVVVTSPMGDQAPPELAAITIMPANRMRSSRSSSNLRTSDTITMVVVRLSSRALRKKLIRPISHINEDRRVVRMRW
jgi:hypothetical protein